MRYFYGFNKFKKLFVFALIITSIANCKTQTQKQQWDEVNVNSQISKDTDYSQLDRQDEILSGFEDGNKFKKRTSNVVYFTADTERINLKNEYSKRVNNCRAVYLHSDTLLINIGISSGFAGWGFTIRYKDKKYYTEPYYFFDAEIPGFEPTYKIVYQKLTLDKATYKVGDSLYGKIDFKSIEITNDKKSFEHFGKGYFRAKVWRL